MEEMLSKAKLHENPLVTNKKLKQLYVAMVEARALDELAARLQTKAKKRRIKSTQGEEACRVSTAIELVSGDLVSDTQDGVVMERIAGESAGSVLRLLNAIISNAKKLAARSASRSEEARQLPWVEDAGDRLRIAMGAALSFKVLGRSNIVVAYVHNAELPDVVWRRLMGLSAKFELPIIFVALPEAHNRNGRSLSAKAQACGVPGFPVDAGDAVALYRVAQESIARTRGDGGPVVIECLTHPLAGRRKNDVDDPIAQMRSFMLVRKIAGKAWLDAAGRGFCRRIEAKR